MSDQPHEYEGEGRRPRSFGDGRSGDRRRPYSGPARDGERRPYRRDDESPRRRELGGDRERGERTQGWRADDRPRSGERRRPFRSDDGRGRPYRDEAPRRPYRGDDQPRRTSRDDDRRDSGRRDDDRGGAGGRSFDRSGGGRSGSGRSYDRSERDRRDGRGDDTRRGYSRDDEGRRSYRGRDERDDRGGRGYGPPRERGERGGHAPRAGRGPRGPRFADRDGRSDRPEEERHSSSRLVPKEGRRPEPPIDEDVTGFEVEREVKNQLRTLSKENAQGVGQHLVMAARLLDVDDERALDHATHAVRRAGRVPAAREALGLVLYHREEWAKALNEFRTARRLSGTHHLLPFMVDCERALGRPEKALELAQSPGAGALPQEDRIELLIVISGIRRDLGQPEAAKVELEVPALRQGTTKPWYPRLAYAYAEALLALGDEERATEWFHRASETDHEGETDADDRLAELEGFTFTDLLEGVEDEDDAPEEGGPEDSAAEDGASGQPEGEDGDRHE